MRSLRRQAARVVVLDADDRVLLLSARDPYDSRKRPWLELPGGGMEPGEGSGAAAAHELYEETGISVSAAAMGPCVWRHHAQFTFAGIYFDQHEHIHVARIAAPGPPGPAPGLEALEALAFDGFRWWALDELASFVGAGGRVIPPWLTDQVPRVLAGGFPAEPIYLGELGPVV